MAAKNETLLNPSFKPSRKRIANRNVNFVLSATLLAGSAVGLIWTVSNIDNFSTPPPASETQTSPKDFPTPPTLSEEERKGINEIPLAKKTKEQGVLTMSPFGNIVNKDNPLGYSLAFQNGTIVGIEMDEKNNTMWIALTMPDSKLTKEATGVKVRNYDGTKTELINYRGFTAWIELQDSVVSVFGSSKTGYQGLGNLKNNLKVGQAITVTSILNQDEANKKYEDMDLYSLSLLNNKEGKPNINRSDTEFKFKGDFVFIIT